MAHADPDAAVRGDDLEGNIEYGVWHGVYLEVFGFDNNDDPEKCGEHPTKITQD